MSNDISSEHGPFGFKFHQVAMYCPDGVGEAVKSYRSIGYDEWSHDMASLRGLLKVDGSWNEIETTAQMAFNYQALPMELEFLKYHGGQHRHRERERLSAIPFISHMSVHVASVKDQMELMKSVYGMEPYHVFVTDEHTNQAVRNHKRFIECIFDTRDVLGYDVKCIERIAWDSMFEASDLLY